MAKVTRIFPSKHVPDRWYAELDGGEAVPVSVALIADLDLYSGKELTDGETSELRSASSRLAARSRALRLLGYRAMSEKELRDRLIEKGESPEDADAAVLSMRDLGFTDDERYASSLVKSLSARGYGPARIRQELSRRGVPREYWEAALNELPEDSGAETINALIQLRTHGVKPDRRELKRLTDMLLRRGFGWREVRQALDLYEFSEETEDIEETYDE